MGHVGFTIPVVKSIVWTQLMYENLSLVGCVNSDNT